MDEQTTLNELNSIEPNLSAPAASPAEIIYCEDYDHSMQYYDPEMRASLQNEQLSYDAIYDVWLPFRMPPSPSIGLQHDRNDDLIIVVEVETKTQIEPSRKLRRDSVPEHEWNRIRPIFEQLYQSNNSTLKAIVAFLAARHKFSAPIHMYKTRIGQWGLKKSFTSEEKKHLAGIAKQCQSSGKPLPSHDEQGRLVPWDRVYRQAGRTNIPRTGRPHIKKSRFNLKHSRYSNDCIVASGCAGAAATPMYVGGRALGPSARYHTGLPRQMAVTTEMSPVERMLFHVKEFHISLNSTPESRLLFYIDFRGTYLRTFEDIRHLSIPAARERLHLAGQIFLQAIQQPNPMLFLDLFSIIFNDTFWHARAYTLLTLRFFASACRQALGAYHPIPVVLELLITNLKFPKIGKELPSTGLKGFPCDRLLQCSVAGSVTPNYMFLKHSEAFKVFKNLTLSLMEIGAFSDIEEVCHDVISSSTQKSYDDQPAVLLRGLLGTAYVRQQRYSEAYRILKPLWDIWTQRHYLNTSEFMVVDEHGDWCPAAILGLVRECQGDFSSCQYFWEIGLRWNAFLHGQRHTSTVWVFKRLAQSYQATMELKKIELMVHQYPITCDIVLGSEENQVDDSDGEIDMEGSNLNT